MVQNYARSINNNITKNFQLDFRKQDQFIHSGKRNETRVLCMAASLCPIYRTLESTDKAKTRYKRGINGIWGTKTVRLLTIY